MYKITSLNLSHLDDITKFYIELKQETFDYNSDVYNYKRKKLKSFEAVKNNIKSNFENNYYWYILLFDNKIVWFIFWYEYIDNMDKDIYECSFNIWVIKNLFIEKKHRKKWYWKKLFNKMHDNFIKNKCEVIELTTNTNWPAKDFYKKLWFSISALPLSKKI